MVGNLSFLTSLTAFISLIVISTCISIPQRPNFRLTIAPNISHFIPGKKTSLELAVTIKNRGAEAFYSMFYLHLPEQFTLIDVVNDMDTSMMCNGEKGENLVVCDIGNSFPANMTVKMEIILQSPVVPSSIHDYTFIAKVNSSNPEEPDHLYDNTVILGIPVRYMIQTSGGVAIGGISILTSIIFSLFIFHKNTHTS